MASIWQSKGLTVTPNQNLVTNIGFGADASNCTDEDHENALIEAGPILPLIHPPLLEADNAADARNFERHFGGKYLRFPRRQLSTMVTMAKAGTARLRGSKRG